MHIAVLLLAPAVLRIGHAPHVGRAAVGRAAVACQRSLPPRLCAEDEAPSDIEEEPEPVSMEMPEPEPEVVDLSDPDPPSDIEQEPSSPDIEEEPSSPTEWKPVGFSPKPPPAAPAPPLEAPAPAPAPPPVAAADGAAADDAAADNAAAERTRLAYALLRLAAGCGRGESATEAQKVEARSLASRLEALNPTEQPAYACEGTWTLAFSDTQLFRSSPFFMAGRAVCADGAEAARYDWFCEQHRAALSIATIGAVRQIVSDDKIVSEFETAAGAVPFLTDFLPLAYSGGLPFAVRGALVSSATIEGNDGHGFELLMDTVEVKGSNLPGVRQALDAGVRLPTRVLGGALEQVLPSYANPKPRFAVTYVDDDLRISRDQDDKLFVYTKASDATTPTDYSDATADLGLGELLQGAFDGLLS